MKIRLILLLSALLPLSAGAGQSSLMLGLGAGYGAEYEGSDKTETTALPLINWEWQRDESCAGGFGLHRASAGVEGVGAAFWCAGRAAVSVNGGHVNRSGRLHQYIWMSCWKSWVVVTNGVPFHIWKVVQICGASVYVL